MAWRVGVDFGGTFTDVCLFDEDTGRVEVWKVPSTPGDPSHGIAEGVAEGVSAGRCGTGTRLDTWLRQDRGHERADLTSRCEDRPDNHRGIPRPA